MQSISIKEFVESVAKNNPGTNKESLTEAVKQAVAAKQAGATCEQCGSPIWAAGVSLVGWNACFTCITGESDSSEDYEIDTVNY